MLKTWTSTVTLIITFVTFGLSLSHAQSFNSEDAINPSTETGEQIVTDSMLDLIKRTPLPVQFGGYLTFSNAQDSLRDALAKLGAPNFAIGFSAYAAYNLDPVPILFGADAGVQFAGQSRKLYSQPNGSGRVDSIEYTSSNTQFPVNAFIRIQPNIETFFFPYAELVGGFRVYSSRLSVEQSNSYMHNSESNSQTDLSWTYGAGLGLMVKFLDVIELPNILQRTLVDARMRYMRGSSVNLHRYIINDNQSITTVNQLVLDPTLVEFSIGITIQF